MSNHLGKNGIFINSIVGEGTKFVGDLELMGLLRIDGDFIGTITTNGKVLIGKNGRAECTITADTVVIGGVVKGDIVCKEKVVILSTGMLIGNVSTPRLISEDGVILNGFCMIACVDESAASLNLNISPDFIKGEGLERYNPLKIGN
jgi:cytoskeletal protein CcmA (bactofilin family)